MPRTDAHTLASLIKDCLLCLALPISQCCGQAYDGAANICGVATLIQEESAICPLFSSLHKSVLAIYCKADTVHLQIFRLSYGVRPSYLIFTEAIQPV